jgi:hypothetical protein
MSSRLRGCVNASTEWRRETLVKKKTRTQSFGGESKQRGNDLLFDRYGQSSDRWRMPGD